MNMEEVFSLVRGFLERPARQEEPPLIVLLGPTASGKTALSLELALRFNGEIVSADSRQVYKYMDIGTDKILPHERRGVAHHGIDLVEPSERFTLGDFRPAAYRSIDDIIARGRIPFLVGGTGLYIESITKNYVLPPENREVRAQLMREFAEVGVNTMHQKLGEIDPVSAKKIHPKNTPYVIRALEIGLITGRPKSAQREQPRYECLQVGLRPPRDIVFDRIAGRIDAQIKKGLIDETKQLLERGFSRDLASMKSLGYREIAAFLSGECTLPAAVTLLKKNTRNFAKRQMTWFKRDREIRWVSCTK